MPLDIESSVTANVDFTAGEWELFTATMNCTAAARRLNKAFNKLIKANPDKTEASANTVHEGMMEACSKESKYGAFDSEPRWRVRDTIKWVYGFNV